MHMSRLAVRAFCTALLLSIALAAAGWARERTVPAEIAVSQLPAEARRTLAAIKQGGPFLYRNDGRVFGNRERLLPRREQGYYREYTVPTPGAKDRGARRIVAGRAAEYYYTEDHYRSFRRIRE